MNLKIQNIRIKGFRIFQDLGIENPGRVNLITGRNNTGKSSILEALRILAENAAPDVIGSILGFREEDTQSPEEGAAVNPEDSYGILRLFRGVPRFSEDPESISISADGSSGAMHVTLRLGRYFREEFSDDRSRLVPLTDDQYDDLESIAALTVEAKDGTRIHPLSRFRHRSYVTRKMSSGRSGIAALMPCTYVSPYDGRRTEDSGPLWDGIALSDREDDVIGALRIIEPGITGVSMIGNVRRERNAIVRAEGFPQPVPLRSFGDGLSRLFDMSVSLVNARGGLLLVDEFENGLHHTVQLDAWRMIFRLARKLDIQVFATSHSWDAIEAFQKAAKETPEDGVLIRLTRRGEDVIPTVFSEEELEVATRERIEVR